MVRPATLASGCTPIKSSFLCRISGSLHAIFHLAAAELAISVKANQNPQEKRRQEIRREELKRQIDVLQGFSNQLITALSEVKASLFS